MKSWFGRSVKQCVQLAVLVAGSSAVTLAATIEVDVNTDGTLGALNGNGTCSLREAIQNANDDAATYPDCSAGSGADTITFNGVTSITLIDSISVISDIKVQGAIDILGGNSTRMFTLGNSNSKLRLASVTLKNGSAAGGGAILQSAGLIDCKGSVFENNKATGNGGAINSSGTVDIDGCSFINNEAGDDGGAIYKLGGAVALTAVGANFANNKAGTDPQSQTNGGSGGAIYITTSPASITGCRFNKNTAQSGNSSAAGGGAIYNNSVTLITASVFAGNEVTGDEWHGGAIFNASSGDLSVNFSHFGTTPLPLPAPFNTLTDPNKSNGTASIGGALFTNGKALILGSSFLGNGSAGNGGAIGNLRAGDDVIIANSTFADNVATGQGGAIYHLRDDQLLTLINVTIADNSAGEGGGIYNNGDGDNADLINDEIYLKNVILANNSAVLSGDNCAGGTASAEGLSNIVFPSGAACPNSPADNSDPVLGSAELTFSFPTIVTYAFPLGTNSSALGAGSASDCSNFPVLSIDQRGVPRPQGDPICDIGAYESDFSVPPSPSPSPSASVSASVTPSASADPSVTPSVSVSPTASPSPSETPSITPTISPSSSPSPSSGSTASPSPSSSANASVSPSGIPSVSSSPSYSPSVSPSQGSLPSASSTVSPSASVSPSQGASATPSASVTPSTSASPSPSASVGSSASPSLSSSPSASASHAPVGCSLAPTVSVACSLEPAQVNLSATITGANPNDPGLSLVWTSDCPLSSILNPGTNPTSLIFQTFESGTGNAVSCKAQLEVALNGVPGSSCSTTIAAADCADFCKELDLAPSQLQLDGNSSAQKNLVRRVVRSFRSARGGGSKLPTYFSEARSKAEQLYLASWNLVWSMPSLQLQCADQLGCTQISNVSTSAAFTENSTSLLGLTKNLIKKSRVVLKQPGYGRQLLNRAKKLHKDNLNLLKQIPNASSVCNSNSN